MEPTQDPTPIAKIPVLDTGTLSYSLTPKDDPKDRVQVEIGDSKDLTQFQPQVKIMRWDNEVNLSYRLITDETADEVVTQEDETIVWDKGNYQVKTYDLPIGAENPEGGHEFEVILKEDPRPDKKGDYTIQFSLNDKDVEYFYQPPLTHEEIDRGIYQPDIVVGSYAVYAKTPKTNWTGGKEYKCGKIGHIFRPQIEDAEGNWVWGELLVKDGILSVTIPQDFLDKAIYPIRHAAGLEFGYHSNGNYQNSMANNEAVGMTGTPASTGLVNSISVYASKFSVAAPAKAVTFLQSNRTILTNGVGNVTANIDAQNWYTATYTTSPSVTGSTKYYAGFVCSTNSMFNFDTGGASGDSNVDSSNNYTTPTTMALNAWSYKFSIYATYTASGGATITPTRTLMGVGA
jgi:hypothetical protein